MKLFRILFLAAVICLMAIMVMWVMDSSGSVGQRHAEFPTLSQGSEGNSAINQSPLALVFGVGSFVLLCLMLFIGVGSRLQGRGRWILLGFSIAYLGILLAIFNTYDGFIEQSQLVLIHGFPTPTVLMVYGIWLFPLVCAVAYVLFFERWVVSPEELSEFRARLKSINNERHEDQV